MTCGVSARRVVRESLQERDRLVPEGTIPRDYKAAFEIAGTWDFKWPLGSTIRVAFQRLPERLRVPEPHYARAKELVRSCARAWGFPLIEKDADAVQSGALRLDFRCDELDPPWESADQRPRHRSSFSPDEAGKNPYDVLISLEPLPVAKFDPLRPHATPETINLPVSALGSYARRADYGVPTMYLGPFGRLAEGYDFAAFYEKPLAQNIVMHELGHMLGLPHMHQHPGLVTPEGGLSDTVRARVEELDRARALFYKDTGAVSSMISTLLGVEVPSEIVEDHLIRVWRGNEAFSDWPALGKAELGAHESTGALGSIMTFPYYDRTLKNGRGCETCTSSAELEAELEGEYPTAPGPQDLKMLRRMYDPIFSG